MTLKDTLGRDINYLRISVTDRCNFRCVYCMPASGITWQPHQNIMKYEEILAVVESAVKYGVKNIRITGGEPLVRPGIVDFVEMLRSIPEIEDISMTTNAFLLSKYAKDLQQAGLNRVNISLDTLDPVLFRKMTRIGDFDQVIKGIHAAEEAGLSPIKINAVVVRGVNDGELVKMASLTKEKPWHVRFIELMPIKNQESWGEGFPIPEDGYISTSEMRAKMADLNLQPVNEKLGNGPARIYQIPNARGFVGFISPIEEEHFCSRCNRMRLTADGNLRPCLMSDTEIPVLAALRSGEPVEEILFKAIQMKPAHHELVLNHLPKNRSMMQIGG